MHKITTSFAEFSLVEPGIICIKMLNSFELAAEQAQEILDHTTTLSEGKQHALLYDFNNQNVLITQIAKQMAQPRVAANSNLCGRALIVYNLSNKLETNNFINTHKPLTPTKVFSTVKEAIPFLRECLNKC